MENFILNEGWLNDDYLILFPETEVASISEKYSVSRFLPGFQILGLLGWDDFIVRDSKGATFTLPTVPLDLQYLSPFVLPKKESALVSDERFTGKIKWYVKPLVFGGNPDVGDNLVWISHEQHAQLVQWWNTKYFSPKHSSGNS
jgi:hypothetical protein